MYFVLYLDFYCNFIEKNIEYQSILVKSRLKLLQSNKMIKFNLDTLTLNAREKNQHNPIWIRMESCQIWGYASFEAARLKWAAHS